MSLNTYYMYLRVVLHSKMTVFMFRYDTGKVCLSLLGTWEGPSWDPQTSTLLQVLVSIQAMILGVRASEREETIVILGLLFKSLYEYIFYYCCYCLLTIN